MVQKEYRFRLKESDVFLIPQALKYFRDEWTWLRERCEDPFQLEAMRRVGITPSKEGIDWILERTYNLILRLERASRGRPKGSTGAR